MIPRPEGVAWAAVAVLALGALYEGLIAVEAIPLGSDPGGDAAGEVLVLAIAMLVSLAGVVVALARAFGAGAPARVVWILLAPAGFAYLLARWLTFDPYYLPSLRRYSEGEIHGTWIGIVFVSSVVAALLAWRVPRAGALVTAPVLLVSALTAWILPIGK